MMNLCFAFNQAPVYVAASYKLFDQEFDIGWCFGTVDGNIKEMDHSLLKNVKVYETIKWKFNTYKFKGIDEVAKDKTIDGYVLIGEFRMLSMWKLPYLIKLHNPKAKILFWTHGWYGREGFAKKLIKKLFFAPVDGILLYGNHARNLMIKEGFKKEKLFVIHNSLNYPVQIKLRNEIYPSTLYSNYFGNTSPVLVMIGRLNMRKHLHLLIEAVAKLKAQGDIFNVVMIGDGEDRQKLELLVDSLNIKEQVWFYGACYDEKTNAELIYNADMCVVPGDIGLTAMHAMMFGCPCITHDYFPNHGPEFEAIQDGITGAFYKQGSVESLSHTIEKWYKEHQGKRDKIRQACYDEIDNNWTPEFELKVLKEALGLK